ncbi:hypothetical protein M885DRAFT_544242 [Pelagophyceae sp. CCMP2097]|nr:hypothetical protein M885DRAFT_544242 [Pelagophyceae sp. CCMP2097]
MSGGRKKAPAQAVHALEALSQRKVPLLATVRVELIDGALLVSASGMAADLRVDLDSAAYAAAPLLRVSASGKSTTGGGGWCLGHVAARKHATGSAWFTEFLNGSAGGAGSKRRSGGKAASNFALVRCDRPLLLSDYPPGELPVIAGIQKRVPDAGSRRFQDFAPLLLVSAKSAADVDALSAKQGATRNGDAAYPIDAFRGNVVITGVKAWDEEAWPACDVVRGGAIVATLRKLKECPRCTIPCRDPQSGAFLFPGDSLRLWKVLGAAFPKKAKDAEWGAWAGPYFGVYISPKLPGDVSAVEIRVGDSLEPHRAPASWRATLLLACAAAAVVVLLPWLLADNFEVVDVETLQKELEALYGEED